MPLIPTKSAGADYYGLLKRLHALVRPRTYVEIGIRQGKSLALAADSSHVVGIDPAPDLKNPLPKGAKVYSTTSDEFFAKHDLRTELGGNSVELAFIDGMHLFEFALRDFLNLEKYSSRAGTILVHDCYPIDATTAARERTTDMWSGDVWKLILCLKKYRPDLEIATVDIRPTGLGIIRNLNPASGGLPISVEQACAEFIPLSFDAIVKNKASELNRLSNEWKPIRELFPSGKKPKRFIFGGNGIPSHRAKPKALGVLLCYNDADVLPDCIEALLRDNHDLIVWDHGSDDGTPQVLDRYSKHFRERKLIPRSFDFYKLHAAMSENLIQNYCAQYDWISWPDQDEILEGPARDKSYYDYLSEVVYSEYDWVQFRNFNYWFTSEDDPKIISPSKRIHRYCLFPDCSRRVRAWRASATNIRAFNHNPPKGKKYPGDFNLRHYPMRSEQQATKRLSKDRVGIQRGGANSHYNHMQQNLQTIMIPPDKLHFDDGKSELKPELKVNWRSIYFGADAAKK